MAAWGIRFRRFDGWCFEAPGLILCVRSVGRNIVLRWRVYPTQGPRNSGAAVPPAALAGSLKVDGVELVHYCCSFAVGVRPFGTTRLGPSLAHADARFSLLSLPSGFCLVRSSRPRALSAFLLQMTYWKGVRTDNANNPCSTHPRPDFSRLELR